MDKSRLELHEILARILNVTEPNDDRHTYYNSPPSVMMRYPAIRYSIKQIKPDFANNGPYRTDSSYEVTLIDEEPDSKYVEKILQIPYCSFDRHYIANNLNHFVFTIHKL